MGVEILRYNYVNTSTPSQNVENEYCGNITI